MPPTSYIGTLRGKLAVDDSGGATYSIPLHLPPGTADMAPSLALVYNSGGGNSILGMGWGLQGLSSIGRVPATIAQDGFIAAVGYGGNDRFALDGQRLVPVAGTSYQDPEAIYHTEIESWQRIVPVYNQQRPAGRSGPDAFIVTLKNGRRLEYGTSADAQIAASASNPSIRVWALNKVTDLNGNYLTISYLQDPASSAFYPSTIQYTGNANTGQAPQRSVQFTFEARPDTWTDWIGGFPVTTTQRLRSVQTFVGSKLILSHGLAYQTGQSTGRSQLQSVTLSDAGGTALTPTTFTWQDGNPGIFQNPQALPGGGSAWRGQLLPMDVNGDGRTDLVNAYAVNGKLGLTLLISNGAGFSATELAATDVAFPEGAQIIPLDVNGDGCMDLVVAAEISNALRLTVLLAQPDGNGGWTYVPGDGLASGSTVPWGRLAALDVDGDGLVDLVCWYNVGGSLALTTLFSNGSQFAPTASTQRQVTGVRFFAGAQLLPIQFGGGPLTDIMYACENGGLFDITLFLSNGRQGFAQQATTPVPSSVTLPANGVLAVLDVNGDGLGDLVHLSLSGAGLSLQTLLATGTAFVAGAGQTFNVGPIGTGIPMLLPMEVTGDGLPDLVIATQNGRQIALTVLASNGSGFVQQTDVAQPATLQWGGMLLPMDIAGDGRGGIVFAQEANQLLTLSHAGAAGVFPDLLSSITNGLGGAITLDYKSLADPSVYARTPAAGQQVEAAAVLNTVTSGATYPLSGTTLSPTPGAAFGTRTVDFPKYVLASYSRTDGRGSSYSYSHFYTGAKIDLTGRGWLGFETIEATDPQYGTATTTTYNQTFPQTSTPDTSLVTRVSDAAWMRQTVFSYTTDSPYPNVFRCLPTSVRTNAYTFAPAPSGGGSPAPDDTHVVSYVYDPYSNRTLTTEVSGSTVCVIDTYANDADAWILGSLTSRTIATDPTATNILSREQQTFYPNTQNIQTQQAWNDQAETWSITQFTYDAYGNCLTVTDPSGAVSSTAYDTTYNSFPVRSVSAPGQSGGSLITTMLFDPGFGVLISRTDPNGATFQQQFDGLGRLTAQLGPNPSDPASAVTLMTRRWASDADGAFIEQQNLADWSGSTWAWSRQYVDGMERTVRSTRLAPDGSATVITDTSFDSKGNIVKQSLPYLQGTTPAYRQSSYDGYGRVVSTEQPVGAVTTTTTMSYPSTNTVVQTEAAGTPLARTTTFVYQTFMSKRRMVQRTDARQAVTTYGYDATGRLVQVVDPFPVTNTFSYDTLGRKISLASTTAGKPLLSETYAYDDLKRQVVQTTGAGATVSLHYDAMKRLVTRTTPSRTTNFLYDQPEVTNGMGRLCAVTMSDGTGHNFAYDAYGNQTGISHATGTASYHFARTFTPSGQIAQLTYPDGSLLTNTYSAAGALTAAAVGESGQAPAAQASFSNFTASGGAQSIGFGNAVQESLGYDPAGRRTSQTLTGPAGTYKDLQLDWNALAAVGGVSDQITPSNSQSFGFDPVGRLQQATGSYGNQSYAYDDVGNLTQKDGITYQSDGYQVVQGTEAGEPVFSAAYDADGNMTSSSSGDASHAMTYDAEGQLTARDGVTFGYDYSGRRTFKTVPAGPATLYVAPYYEVTTLPNGSVQHTKYVRGPKGLIASVTTVDSGTGNSPTGPFKGVPVPGVAYFHKDHLGSITAVTGAAGNVTATVDYLPFGEVGTVSGPDVFRFKFSGREFDAETGLYYFRSRYYDPSLGRFLTADSTLGGPLSMHDSLNRYAYVLNNPVSFTDPTGHSIWTDIGHFFTHDVKWFFTNKIVENIYSFVIDAGLVVAGIAVAALGGSIIGSTLLGAGIGGLAYDISNLASGGTFSWASFGEQLGIGAAGGFISGGIAWAGGAIVDAASASAQSTAWAVGGAARITVNIASGAVANGVSGTVTTIFNNLASHSAVTKSLGWGALIGALTGAAAGAASGGVAARIDSANPVEKIDDIGYQADDEIPAANIRPNNFAEGYEKLLGVPKAMVSRTVGNFLTGLPGDLFSGVDAFLTTFDKVPQW